ncbi:hypothetical protein V3C99_004270, partial [Haemonchus contortus]
LGHYLRLRSEFQQGPEMIVLFVVGLLVPSVLAGECSISSGDISAEIRAEGDRVKVKFVNPSIANDKWTGVAFGKKMNDLEVVLVTIKDNTPSVVTGYTNSKGPPKLDEASNVETDMLILENGNLTFQFTRPMGKHGPREHSLEGCQMWNFVRNGKFENGVFKNHRGSKIHKIEVCPAECKEGYIKKAGSFNFPTYLLYLWLLFMVLY